MTKTLFPFSAVVGQHDYKLALLLLAVDPHLGGVVVSGPRGTAKSTLARGFSELLNLEQNSEASGAAPFVNLPLGASEEMLVGTMDLEQVLQERTQRFRPGLLAQAHQGVLYVDEVNLLPDTLVDVLLDVSASGVNHVERDGVSHSHAADFVLVGTMNPDEGELRPQLLDRFGFCVELNDQFTAAQRVEVIKARQAFDQNAEIFRASFADEQAQLAKSIQSARERLSSTAIEDSQLLDIAERCAEAQVDGFRADIVWAKAAKAHAAWRGASTVGSLDIDAVQELVLRHRRQQANSSNTPPSQPDQNNRSSDQEQSPPPFRRPPESRRDSVEQPSGSSEQAENDWGQMSTEAHADIQVMDPTHRAALDDVLAKTSGDTLNGGRVSKQNAPKRISWFQTCLQSLPAWPPKTLSWQAKPKRGQTLHMLVLDTSASMREGQQFSAAKGVVQDVFRSAYLKREWVSAISFGNAAAKPIFERLRAPKQIDTWLNTIETGGGTPLLEGLEAAKQHALQVLKREPKLAIKFYVISDGRSLANLSALTLPGQTVWVDIEQSAVSRGRGRDLAEQLCAHYFHLFRHSLPI